MAIIKCPECGREISDKAPACPHCGIVNPSLQRAKDRLSSGRTEQPNSQAENHGKNESNHHPYRWLVILGVIAVLAVAGIYAYLHVMQQKMENDKYEQAFTTTNTSVIQNYLDLHPDLDSSKRRQLEDRMATLKFVDNEWYDAVDSDSRAALIKFIRMHPNDYRINEANLKVDSLDWQNAKRQDDIFSYETYLNQHTDGVYYDEALRRLQNLKNAIVEPEVSDEEMIMKEMLQETDSTMHNNNEND
ncbi:MAG: zinc ribbon domain-containing protein [Prevotellaceae bacterium]|nr:zinc ribbon domain-containing protein [Prevotellaceae bacterium]